MNGVLDKVEMSLHQHIAAWHLPRQIARFALTVTFALPGVLAAGRGRLDWADLWAALPAAASVAVEQMWKTVPLEAVLATLAAERQKSAPVPRPPEADEAP